MEHIYHEREDGLAHCKVCNGGEGSLPTTCPGKRMSVHMEEAVYAGLLDHTMTGWVDRHAKTSQPIKSWRANGTRDFGSWSLGSRVHKLSQLTVGTILVNESRMFDSLNLCKITKINADRGNCYAVFVNPLDTNEGRPGVGKETEFAIWDFEFEARDRTLFFALPCMSAPIQMNAIAVYEETGKKAGKASKAKDSALVAFHTTWLRKALALETEPYRTQARKAFDTAYSEAATPVAEYFL